MEVQAPQLTNRSYKFQVNASFFRPAGRFSPHNLASAIAVGTFIGAGSHFIHRLEPHRSILDGYRGLAEGECP
jgi:hypothetical protein